MDPIRLSRGERAALRKLQRHNGTCEQKQIRPAHAARLLRDGLLFQTPQRYHLTMLGQVEILRQRFRGVRGIHKAAAGESGAATDEWLFA